ncbi:AsmA-like C-terminal region-containing protein [Amantichitinum ursilacus]|uniref:AsmA-like C-terminal region-containing protein n=1 Tax=Amantichitinum ursilacus TaxID=857265 RepID=UPI00137921DD|nr:AsmA-like C-terminal region-containing protein [Amantichitinum ursilacus]
MIILIIFLAFIAALPIIVPLQLFSGDATRLLQRITHSNIQLQQLGFEYSPRPALVLQDITIDGDPAIGHIEYIRVPLTMYNVLHWGRDLREVTVEGGHFSPQWALQLPQKLRPQSGEATIHFADLHLVRTSIVRNNGEVGPVDGVLKFDSGSNLAGLTVSDSTGRMTLEILPQGSDFATTLNASGWDVPLGYPVHFDSLQLKGIANQNGLQITEIHGELYSGVLSGTARVDWTDGWKLTGTVHGSSVQAEPLSKLFNPTTFVSGRIEGDANFSYAGDSYQTLLATPQIESTMTIKQGAIHNFDLIAPLKSTVPVTYARGGITRFDTLTGGMNIANHVVLFSNVKVDAGKFVATGAMKVEPGNKLSGGAQARLQAGVIAASSQIRIGGKLEAPVFQTGGAWRQGHDDALEQADKVQTKEPPPPADD